VIDNVSALFVFNCIARKAFLGNRAEEEIKKIYELAESNDINYGYRRQINSWDSIEICFAMAIFS